MAFSQDDDSNVVTWATPANTQTPVTWTQPGPQEPTQPQQPTQPQTLIPSGGNPQDWLDKMQQAQATNDWWKSMGATVQRPQQTTPASQTQGDAARWAAYLRGEPVFVDPVNDKRAYEQAYYGGTNMRRPNAGEAPPRTDRSMSGAFDLGSGNENVALDRPLTNAMRWAFINRYFSQFQQNIPQPPPKPSVLEAYYQSQAAADAQARAHGYDPTRGGNPGAKWGGERRANQETDDIVAWTNTVKNNGSNGGGGGGGGTSAPKPVYYGGGGGGGGGSLPAWYLDMISWRI